MKHNKPVDYAIEEGLDDLYPPDFNPARTPVVEPEKKINWWPLLIFALGLGLGFATGYIAKTQETTHTVDDLRLAERQAVEKMEAALDFTKLIKSDTIEAAQALYACRSGKPSAFVFEATKLEAENRKLPIVFDQPFKDTEAAQDLAWKGAQ
jgi:hypothetical protein